MINVNENIITVDTKTVYAEFFYGKLVLLKSKGTGTVFASDEKWESRPLLQIVYSDDKRIDIDFQRNCCFSTVKLSSTRVNVMLNAWNGTGIISISEDIKTGDIIVEPSASTALPGVRSVRWDVCGLLNEAQLVAPLYQGVKANLDDPMIRNSRFIYPYKWESGFVALQGHGEGMWIYADDSRFKFKTLNIGDGLEMNRLGFETEASGPITSNLSSGGCAWHINVYTGGWDTPVLKYKKILWETLNLEKRRKLMPEWLKEIKLAYSWCPTDRKILSELKRYLNPQNVLIHLPNWRLSGYDKDYPDYTASGEAVVFIKQAIEMGYHVAPHFNAYEIDPSRKEFDLVRDFRFREIETRRSMGWAYDPGFSVPVPEGITVLRNGQKYNVMTKIHPGCSEWRFILEKSVCSSVEQTGTDTVFVDVTHNIFNLDNEYVNNMSCGEGATKLLHEIASIHDGICVGGEGLNEVVADCQFFAQGHILIPVNGSGRENITKEKLCPVNSILYDGVCRIIGYHPNVGNYAEIKRTDELDEARGFVPTLIGIGPEDLTNPDRVIKEILDRATD